MKLEVSRKAAERPTPLRGARALRGRPDRAAWRWRLAVGLFVARLIARPLGQAGEVLEGVAAGDFTGRLDLDTRTRWAGWPRR